MTAMTVTLTALREPDICADQSMIDMRSLGLSDSALEELMLKNYLALDEGYIFGTGGSGFERWNLALPQNELKAALERLKAAVLSLQSKQ